MALHLDIRPFYSFPHFACEKGGSSSGAFCWNPTKTNCKMCKETEVFKRVLILFEIGFDGDAERWEQYISKIDDMREL